MIKDLGLHPAMMTNSAEKKTTDRLDTELRSYFEANAGQNYSRLAEELHILVEMVFGKDHSALSEEDKGHLNDLHDVINHYKLRSAGEPMNMEGAVQENKARVEQVMETYGWVIGQVKERYSPSQLKYVEHILEYMEHVQLVVAKFLETVRDR